METQQKTSLHGKSRVALLCMGIGAMALAPGVPALAAPSVPVACNDARAEARLRERETAVLGARHAAEHADARRRQCRAAKGLEAARTVDPAALSAAAVRPANVMGRWGSPIRIPVAGVTAVLLHNGKVLFWSYEPGSWGNPNGSNTGVAYLWDPATRSGRSITPPENIWCAGQTILGDGRVYIAGGNLRYPDPSAEPGQGGWQGTLTHYTFNPNNASFTRQYPDMITGRWYPTVTQLGDDRVVITSGYDENGGNDVTQQVEIFTPSPDMDGNGSITEISPHNPSGLYPFQYVLASGDMLQAGPGRYNSSLLDVDLLSWSALPPMQAWHYDYGNGLVYADASVTPVRQVVLVAGGVTAGPAVTGDIEMLDGTNPAAGWKAFPRWAQRRHNSNTVILADGTLLTVGGNSATSSYGDPVFDTELYTRPPTDATGSWVKVMPHTVQAAYHSTAILLPDATVLLAQDDQDKSPTAAQHVQVYSPPYLFKGSRPRITFAPPAVTWGQAVAILTDTPRISGAMLIAPGATTHGNDMHQRAIKLPSRTLGRTVQVTIPSSSSLVPPGYYMLFVLNATGVPSVAKFIRVM
ncbi:galactose oxidase early set domain-containing protein [Massilia sp. METH4]|uniref:galactose oxidase early set domain-containing protein n=1 Tax=Massilia sp. METH4 TaxID=3123041 RepID=UPI0030D170B9